MNRELKTWEWVCDTCGCVQRIQRARKEVPAGWTSRPPSVSNSRDEYSFYDPGEDLCAACVRKGKAEEKKGQDEIRDQQR